ncbi:hypothetical protein V6N12_041806 [Hibiscus sabdariffa]|uniref:Uncharacterized protein n=1 Tax=Hibiscus sabdariffa TaxID=183260 RepID=A0ABR2ECX8_9ROSI
MNKGTETISRPYFFTPREEVRKGNLKRLSHSRHSAFDFAPVLCSSKSQLEFRGGRGIKDSDQSIMEGRRRCFGAKVDTLISSFN